MNASIMYRLLSELQSRIARLQTFQTLSFEQFSGDWRTIWAVEHGLHTLIQIVIDIGTHILASIEQTDWDEYREIPELLAREGVIPPDIVPMFQAMIGFRNLLVHEYAHVDLHKVYDILQNRLHDFEILGGYFFDFVEKMNKREQGGT